MSNKIDWTTIDSVNYSASEVKIGTWTDGKPLYRKVIDTTVYKADNDHYAIATNVKLFTSIQGWVQRNDYTNLWQPLPSRVGNDFQFMVWTTSLNYDNAGTAGVQIKWGNSYAANSGAMVKRVILIVEYTKSTD